MRRRRAALPIEEQALQVADLGLSEGAVRMQLQRLREKFRLQLRVEVMESLLPGKDVSAEMRYLAEVMGNE